MVRTKINQYAFNVGLLIWYGALCFFAYLMLLITLQYIPVRTDVAFLRIKEDVVGKLHYRVAFFMHVFTAMLVLLAGIIQFPAYIRVHRPILHRWCGRVYAYGILLFAGPSGLVMGFYGNGGWISRVSFCMLAVLWMIFTYKGVVAAIHHQTNNHRFWMYRSFALTLSAISLRLWKWLLVFLFEPRPMDVYHIVSWLGWTGNLFIAELYIYLLVKRSVNARLP